MHPPMKDHEKLGFPIQSVRANFPSLDTTDAGQRRIYFDNAAGTQVPQQTIDRVTDFYTRFNSNTGVFNSTSIEVDLLYRDATIALADFLGTSDPGEILIGANMTTLTYQISRSLAHRFKAGDEIIITRMEHEGNVSPWLQMAEEEGLIVRWLDFDRDTWRVEPDQLGSLLTEKTKLLALNYASNLTGGVNNVGELTARAKDAGALVYVDAVQFASHHLIDVRALSCDFLACSPYKFFGPHLGVVFGRRELLEEMHAYKLRCASEDLPLRFSTGTPAFELIAGLMGTFEYFEWLADALGAQGQRRDLFSAAYSAMGDHEYVLSSRFLEGLRAIPGLTIQGPKMPENRVATFSFIHKKQGPSAIAKYLSQKGLFCHWGDNYAFEIARALALHPKEGVVRLGLAHYNTISEIDEALGILSELLA